MSNIVAGFAAACHLIAAGAGFAHRDFAFGLASLTAALWAILYVYKS